jgi:hypothetical protein
MEIGVSWSKYNIDAIVKGNIGGAVCHFVMGFSVSRHFTSLDITLVRLPA